MKRTLLALALAAAAPLFAQTDADKLVARINGEELTRGQLDVLWSRVPPKVRDQYEDVGGKAVFLENYVGKRLLIQDAIHSGFAKKIGAPDDLDADQESVLFDRYVRDVIAAPMITEEAMRKVYDERRAEFVVPEQAKLRIIHVSKGDTPQSARETASKAMIELFSIRNTLTASMGPDNVQAALATKFSEVAQRVSDDPSAAAGGEVGWVKVHALDGKIAEAARSMKPGTMSGILETKDAYELILLEDHHAEGEAPFDATRDVIREYLMARNAQAVMQALTKKTAELRAAGKVEIFRDNIE